MSAATKVFIATNFVKQHFLCYLIPIKSQLIFVEMDRLENNDVSLGNLSSVPAKDAAYLSVNKIFYYYIVLLLFIKINKLLFTTFFYVLVFKFNCSYGLSKLYYIVFRSFKNWFCSTG